MLLEASLIDYMLASGFKFGVNFLNARRELPNLKSIIGKGNVNKLLAYSINNYLNNNGVVECDRETLPRPLITFTNRIYKQNPITDQYLESQVNAATYWSGENNRSPIGRFILYTILDLYNETYGKEIFKVKGIHSLNAEIANEFNDDKKHPFNNNELSKFMYIHSNFNKGDIKELLDSLEIGDGAEALGERIKAEFQRKHRPNAFKYYHLYCICSQLPSGKNGKLVDFPEVDTADYLNDLKETYGWKEIKKGAKHIKDVSI